MVDQQVAGEVTGEVTGEVNEVEQVEQGNGQTTTTPDFDGWFEPVTTIPGVRASTEAADEMVKRFVASGLDKVKVSQSRFPGRNGGQAQPTSVAGALKLAVERAKLTDVVIQQSGDLVFIKKGVPAPKRKPAKKKPASTSAADGDKK